MLIRKLDEIGHPVEFRIARRRTPIRKMAEGWQKTLIVAAERIKASVRAKVEHPFNIVKNIFKHKKARYKGLAKNHSQVTVLFALSNLYMARGKLCP